MFRKGAGMLRIKLILVVMLNILFLALNNAGGFEANEYFPYSQGNIWEYDSEAKHNTEQTSFISKTEVTSSNENEKFTLSRDHQGFETYSLDNDGLRLASCSINKDNSEYAVFAPPPYDNPQKYCPRRKY